ncbi:hypothetical protein Ancab_003098 [Ancistrocladus abbreviatus]
MAAASSKKMNSSRCHLRSISLPSKSNPIIQKIGEELNKLKSWEASSTSEAESISIGLSGLGDLYRCIDDVITLPSTQQCVFRQQHEKFVEELLETSLRLLDICTATREIVLQLKEAVRDLRSALRRRMYDLSIESSIANYISSRKRIIRSAKGLVSSLKQVEENFGSSRVLEDDHHHLSMVIKALRCVSIINISTYESLLFFLSMPVQCKLKCSKWSLVSKLMQRRVIESREQAENNNELDNVDLALSAVCCSEAPKARNLQLVDKRLEALETGVEGIENGLDSMFRQLIKTRASLLNIISF